MPTATITAPQPRATSQRAGPIARSGNIKSVLLSIRGDESLGHRLQTALSIARTCSAHLQFVQIVPIEAYTFADSYGGTYITGDIVRSLEEQAGKLEGVLKAKLKSEDVSWDYELVTSALTAELLGRAALNDLVILGREPHTREFGYSGIELIERFLFGSRTPVFIPGDSKAIPEITGTAVVAWNGSYEAANAVRSAIGLLKLASNVRVVRVTEPKKGNAFPDTRLLQYLSRHDIHAELEEREADFDVASDLLSYADDVVPATC